LYLVEQEALDELRKKKTFSAVGFGHDRIPFLSTQHSACKMGFKTNNRITSQFTHSDRAQDMEKVGRSAWNATLATEAGQKERPPLPPTDVWPELLLRFIKRIRSNLQMTHCNAVFLPPR